MASSHEFLVVLERLPDGIDTVIFANCTQNEPPVGTIILYSIFYISPLKSSISIELIEITYQF